MSLLIPHGLRPLLKTESGRHWIDRVPRLLSELSQEWGLTTGPPYESSTVSYTVPARRGSDEVVLKLQWPHEECLHEAAALSLWKGRGAVSLLEYDADRNALLLERCIPGDSLGNSTLADKLPPLVSLLSSLMVEAHGPFMTLEAQACRWLGQLDSAKKLDNGPFDIRVLETAARYLHELASTQGPQYLLHQDLHGDNILASLRQPWLAIDPKPLVGEHEFTVVPLVRSPELGHSRNEVIDRLDRLCSALDLNRERARRWTIAQTVAWNLESDANPQRIETVQWLMDA